MSIFRRVASIHKMQAGFCLEYQNIHISLFHAKHVYNLQPYFTHCPNVKNFSVKVSLFLCDVRVFRSSTQEFIIYTCFDDDTLILPQIFCLINSFLGLLIFRISHLNKGIISLLRVVSTRLVLH